MGWGVGCKCLCSKEKRAKKGVFESLVFSRLGGNQIKIEKHPPNQKKQGTKKRKKSKKNLRMSL